jgi:hypothetical protein
MEIPDRMDELVELQRLKRIELAVIEHHKQKADDRCVFDDDKLYEAAGLPQVDRRVGDKAAMLINCARFIEKRCEAGGWPSYADLERRIETYKLYIKSLLDIIDGNLVDHEQVRKEVENLL